MLQGSEIYRDITSVIEILMTQISVTIIIFYHFLFVELNLLDVTLSLVGKCAKCKVCHLASCHDIRALPQKGVWQGRDLTLNSLAPGRFDWDFR